MLNPFSSPIRPALGGNCGAVSAAHPLAVAAGQQMLSTGGNAVDALIAAQAVLAVVAPDSCGLGGDAFVILHDGQDVIAINGAGASPARARQAASDGAHSVTVPGLVDTWALLAPRARLGLAVALAPAVRIAGRGCRVDPGLAAARDIQKPRLLAGGAVDWPLMSAKVGSTFRQPELARTLERIASEGREGLYAGPVGAEMIARVAAGGGALTEDDLVRPAATLEKPISLTFCGHYVHVQPPVSQGILLAMALNGWEGGGYDLAERDHIAVELTQAAFAHRDDVARGIDLLLEPLEIDPKAASLKGGPRSYLHTAGVAVADAEGMVTSSLVSVFDDFGSGVFLPNAGFCLNNRGGGFTGGLNGFGPGKKPIHTLAPVLIEGPSGTIALSTPGADGQVQTLLQVLIDWLAAGQDLAETVAAPRWRSEDGALLVEAGHPARDRLRELGHRVEDTASGDMRFGAVTAAGIECQAPFALADWRRTTWAGVA